MASAHHMPEDISRYQELPAVGYSPVYVLWEQSNKLLILLFLCCSCIPPTYFLCIVIPPLSHHIGDFPGCDIFLRWWYLYFCLIGITWTVILKVLPNTQTPVPQQRHSDGSSFSHQCQRQSWTVPALPNQLSFVQLQLWSRSDFVRLSDQGKPVWISSSLALNAVDVRKEILTDNSRDHNNLVNCLYHLFERILHCHADGKCISRFQNPEYFWYLYSTPNPYSSVTSCQADCIYYQRQ